MADGSASFAVSLRDMLSRNAKRMAGSLGVFNRRLGETEKSTLGLGRSTTSASGQITAGMGRAQGATESFLASSLKLEAIKAGAAAVIGLGGAMYESAAFTDQMTLAFDQLTHGHGAETLTHTRRMAEMLGLEVHGTAKAYKNFLALQFKPAMADKLLLMGGDMQALGASAEEVQGIFTALGQIKSKGRLQGEELLQLQERGISGQLVKEELAKQLGLKDIAQVDKLQQAGKIGADDFFVAFEKAINRKLGQSAVGETGKRFAETNLAGMVGVLKAKATNIWDALVAGGAMDNLKSGVKELGDQLVRFALSPEGVASFKMATSAVQTLFTVATTAIPWLFKAFSATAEVFAFVGDNAIPILSSALVLLAPAGYAAATAGWAAASAWIAATAPILAVAAAVGGLTWLIMQIEWGQVAENFAYLWGDIKAGALGLWESVKNAFSGALEWAKGIGGMIVQGLTEGIKAYFMFPVQAITWLAEKVLGGARAALGIRSPSKEFEQLGLYSGQGYTEGLLSSMAPANDVLPTFAAQSARSGGPSFSGISTGGGRITLNLTINVSGSVDGEAVAGPIAKSVREEIDDYFRSFAEESAA